MFKDRVTIHDEIAMPIVVQQLEAKGYECHKMGIETDTDALYYALAKQDNQISRMLRFKPDIVAIREDSILCEVKTEPENHYNFAVEADSYSSASMWNRAVPERVMYAFIDLVRDKNGRWEADLKGRIQKFKCVNMAVCWANDIPRPTKIFVPKRWDFQENYARMQEEWPYTRIESVKHTGGSGTPYFLIPKRANYLINSGPIFP